MGFIIGMNYSNRSEILSLLKRNPVELYNTKELFELSDVKRKGQISKCICVACGRYLMDMRGNTFWY